MRLLLDTHAFIWWLLNDRRLSQTALRLLIDPSNQLFLSSASTYEIAAKVAIGKLRLPTSLHDFVDSSMKYSQIRELPITFRHTYHIERLPMLHRDPFDRLLVGVAIEEDLKLLTCDAEIMKYPVSTVW